MKTIPSVEQYVHALVAKHPNLFASTEYEISKFHVLDQLLNVNGNGIRNSEELFEELQSVDIVDASRYFTEPTTTGYYSVVEYGSGYLHPNLNGDKVNCFVSEKDNYPEVKKWTDCDLPSKFKMPYPNFRKRYSIVWRDNGFLSLDKGWLEAAIWFYKKARNIIYLREHEYSYSFPTIIAKENKEIIKNQLVAFGTRTYEEISRDWCHPYDGDIVKFLTTKWQKEKQEIFDFIDETVEMLEKACY